jgi:hypothetical protein
MLSMKEIEPSKKNNELKRANPNLKTYDEVEEIEAISRNEAISSFSLRRNEAPRKKSFQDFQEKKSFQDFQEKEVISRFSSCRSEGIKKTKKRRRNEENEEAKASRNRNTKRLKQATAKEV